MAMQYGADRRTLTAATVTTGGAVLALANPVGETLIVTKLVLYIPTPSTGAAEVNAGIGATSTTSSDNLIDGLSTATAGVFDNITDKGANGKSRQTWSASQYLTITASATLAGMVAYAYIEYYRTGAEA